MARNLGTSQITVAVEHRSYEIVLSLPRGNTPSMFIRRERVLLQDGVQVERRELEAILVTPDMLTAQQRNVLQGVIQTIDERADALEAAQEANT